MGSAPMQSELIRALYIVVGLVYGFSPHAVRVDPSTVVLNGVAPMQS